MTRRKPARGQARAAALLREISRRELSPAELAARETHRRRVAEHRAWLRQTQVDRIAEVVSGMLPDTPPILAAMLAEAVLDTLAVR